MAKANDDRPPLPDTKPLFPAMFTDRARQAVTKTVSSLWAPDQRETPATANATAASESVRPLELFTDRAPDTRKLFSGGA